MTQTFKILPYKKGSRSVRALADALNCKVLRLVNCKWKPKQDTIVINWGASEFGPLHEVFAPDAEQALLEKGISIDILNSPIRTREVTDKLKFFQAMSDTGITPAFWTDCDSIPSDTYPIVCRTVLNGHSGAGIVIADSPSELVDAPLYVKYVKKQKEFRIHVGKGGVIIAEQQKVKRSGTEILSWRIRNHANGFIYQRQRIDVPLVVRSVAQSCLAATGLDFGAVDVIYTKGGKAFVLEVNTAPGLSGSTIEDYATFFKGMYNE
jgi:glutathione synthase/RimK-type ligase-like ATP-grasp enzyme